MGAAVRFVWAGWGIRSLWSLFTGKRETKLFFFFFFFALLRFFRSSCFHSSDFVGIPFVFTEGIGYKSV